VLRLSNERAAQYSSTSTTDGPWNVRTVIDMQSFMRFDMPLNARPKNRRVLRSISIGFLAVLVVGVAVFVLSGAARRRARSFSCASSVVSICCAGHLWADDHGGNFPTNLICMSNELATPKILSCLPDRRANSWSAFTPDNCTYEVVTPGVHQDATNAAFLRCIIHGHLGYPDMTVFDGVRRRGKFN